MDEPPRYMPLELIAELRRQEAVGVSTMTNFELRASDKPLRGTPDVDAQAPWATTRSRDI